MGKKMDTKVQHKARKLSGKVVDKDQANVLCGGAAFNPENEFCYRVPHIDGVLCKHDDGDPILEWVLGAPGKWQQVGIQVRGHEHCDSQYTIATALGPHSAWIYYWEIIFD